MLGLLRFTVLPIGVLQRHQTEYIFGRFSGEHFICIINRADGWIQRGSDYTKQTDHIIPSENKKDVS